MASSVHEADQARVEHAISVKATLSKDLEKKLTGLTSETQRRELEREASRKRVGGGGGSRGGMVVGDIDKED